jgi:Na+-driven multidrug efflux pump
VRTAGPADEVLNLRSFLEFYIPLALTSLLTLLTQPLGSAALSRMPDPLASLAVWPVVSGLVFMSRSLGVAYNEVVVALLDRKRSYHSLRRFTFMLAVGTSAFLFLMAVTPLSDFWFRVISGLPARLAPLGTSALLYALPMPGLVVLHSWFQGGLVNQRKTRGVTESVALALFASAVVLVFGVMTKPLPGLYVVWIALGVGALIQMLWLWWRSRRAMRRVRLEDRPSNAPAPDILRTKI